MLLTCATWNYRHLLQPLLASHHASNPSKTLNVHAIDWPEDELSAAAAAFPHARFHPCELPSDDERPEMLGPVPRSAAILKLKVQLLHQHYHNTNTPVIWVDADTLLLESVDPLLQRVEGHGDFAVTYRRKKRNHAKFAVAVLCFTRTAAAEALLNAYADNTAHSTGLVKRSATDGVAWFHDQLALWDAYRAQKRSWISLSRANTAKLVALTDTEHSIDGKTNAVFVSRRDGVLDLSHMQDELRKRGMFNTANLALHSIKEFIIGFGVL